MALNLVATKPGGRELPSEKVNITSQGVVFALISSDGITLQQYERLRPNETDELTAPGLL